MFKGVHDVHDVQDSYIHYILTYYRRTQPLFICVQDVQDVQDWYIYEAYMYILNILNILNTLEHFWVLDIPRTSGLFFFEIFNCNFFSKYNVCNLLKSINPLVFEWTYQIGPLKVKRSFIDMSPLWIIEI